MVNKKWLLKQLTLSFFEARKHKSKTTDEHNFEVYWQKNLEILANDIINKQYEPSRGVAFITKKPVIREIFAAPFRDRVVHHLIYRLVYRWWDRHFIKNSFSCREGKGTLYGARELAKAMRKTSGNGRKKAYVVKMDISGYFMSLPRKRLYQRALWGLNRQFPKKGSTYQLLKYLWKQIIFDDPVKGVKKRLPLSDWDLLPYTKSLFKQPFGYGIVIGNLTSQLLSNIYLDQLDQFVTKNLGYKHYGRYVDDFYIVVPAEKLPQLKRDIKVIAKFLKTIELTVHPHKTQLQEVRNGIEFLGAKITPFCISPGVRFRNNFLKSMRSYAKGKTDINSVVSYIGHCRHYASKKLCERAFYSIGLPFDHTKWAGGIEEHELRSRK